MTIHSSDFLSQSKLEDGLRRSVATLAPPNSTAELLRIDVNASAYHSDLLRQSALQLRLALIAAILCSFFITLMLHACLYRITKKQDHEAQVLD